MKTIKWGILGLGKIAHSFAKDLLTVPGNELTAVASRTIEKAEDFKTEYKAAKAYGSYEELAADPEVDVVYIATPHVRHCEDSILCMENGKAVLCEKPFAMNAGEVEKMIASAKENKVLLMEALWTRIMPHFNFALEEIASGKYGKIEKITSDFCFDAPFDPEGRLWDKKLGGGALLDVGIYPIFCVLAFLGKPEKISAKAKMGKTEVDVENSVTFTYKDGAKGYIKSAINTKTPTTTTIICENGLLYMHPRFHNTDKVTTILDGVKTEHDFDYSAKGYNFEIMHMAAMLREGVKESDMMTYDFSRLIINTLDTIRAKIGLEY
ncbi:Gfo/Idh/MocA family protein [Flavimarina sp. Hel_I_48]|uniref:Gfo/Idh/MocA family protein n=1 Tax=Flavimarina sp. Hel_I_48 TaxID=1392488 RepID=UPI0004DF45B5|nr:Gfo/Idh/MocA family oxidoreductase [Flavimarina sp. Hel_I_48]